MQGRQRRRLTNVVAAAVVMIYPEAFGPNPETAASNALQHNAARRQDAAQARVEAVALRDALVAQGVRVHEFEGRVRNSLPDECFPNNWFSTHPDGTVVLYPMMAVNRRGERRADVVDRLRSRYRVSRVVDLSGAELNGQYLEGTGSVVIDQRHGIGFAGLSARTDHALALQLGHELDLEMVTFTSGDASGQPYYHTNVILSVASQFALWCPDALPKRRERRRVAERLALGGREVIEVSRAQVHRFAANLLALAGADGPLIALSNAGRAALTADQASRLADHGRLVSVAVPTVERLGGGSVRCMLAEVHLPARQ